MAPKRGWGHPPKRAALETATDIDSAHGVTAHDLIQSDKDREIERLRLEIQRLQEVAWGKSQTSSTSFPMPSASELRRVVRKTTDEREVSLKDFLGYGTTKFRGKIGEDP